MLFFSQINLRIVTKTPEHEVLDTAVLIDLAGCWDNSGSYRVGEYKKFYASCFLINRLIISRNKRRKVARIVSVVIPLRYLL